MSVGAVRGGLLLIYRPNTEGPFKRVKLGSIKRPNQCTNECLGTFFCHCKIAVTDDLFVQLVGDCWPYFMSPRTNAQK